jgi:phenylpyruvate tautomerase PptA (4-oxalocrotonate tautomerase family)
MPYLSVRTNLSPEAGVREDFLEQASRRVAELLGKSEQYVMVNLKTGQEMRFGGIDAPLAYLELKSIGLPEERTGDISADLCALVSGTLGVPVERIYIEFSNAERHLWGWNGGTF